MPGSLGQRLRADELMDDPALDPATFHAVLADLAKVNRITFAYRPTLAFLRRAVGERKQFRLLDVGFGDGDMLRQIARWAERHDIAADKKEQVAGLAVLGFCLADVSVGGHLGADRSGPARDLARFRSGEPLDVRLRGQNGGAIPQQHGEGDEENRRASAHTIQPDLEGPGGSTLSCLEK